MKRNHRGVEGELGNAERGKGQQAPASSTPWETTAVKLREGRGEEHWAVPYTVKEEEDTRGRDRKMERERRERSGWRGRGIGEEEEEGKTVGRWAVRSGRVEWGKGRGAM